MYARIATFESDPSTVDDAIELVRKEVDGDTPEGLEGAKMMMLVDRDSGRGLGITLFDSEDAMRRRRRGAQQHAPRRQRAAHLRGVLRGTRWKPSRPNFRMALP